MLQKTYIRNNRENAYIPAETDLLATPADRIQQVMLRYEADGTRVKVLFQTGLFVEQYGLLNPHEIIRHFRWDCDHMLVAESEAENIALLAWLVGKCPYLATDALRVAQRLVKNQFNPPSA